MSNCTLPSSSFWELHFDTKVIVKTINHLNKDISILHFNSRLNSYFVCSCLYIRNRAFWSRYLFTKNLFRKTYRCVQAWDSSKHVFSLQSIFEMIDLDFQFYCKLINIQNYLGMNIFELTVSYVEFGEHSVEITGIFSLAFLAKISSKWWFY